ncbi:MAG: diphosphomevalonate decarboxylase [Lactobacillaceae bacterium]|jgi:diphosphomevalonate decarboxylase|nr:diphosphomevalonate decarboxylase [Lactobacillaceae bacterium]
MIYQAKSKAYTNIALTKYWGKRDEKLNLPTTSSIGLTLDHFSTTTSIEFNPELKKNIFYLDNQKTESEKINKVLNFVQAKYNIDMFAKIESFNNVPLSSGFASSASAFAALAYAIDSALGLGLSKPKISEIARIGSGSASRSIFNGFSLWDKDSGTADELMDKVNFDIQIIDLIANEEIKAISSSLGMQLAQTSLHYQDWVYQSAIDTKNMITAIYNIDLEQIGFIAEKNALSMHLLNRTAKKPFDYFTKQTNDILERIKALRNNGVLAFATIDAGPNIKIITNSHNSNLVLNEFNDISKKIVQKPGLGATFVD